MICSSSVGRNFRVVRLKLAYPRSVGHWLYPSRTMVRTVAIVQPLYLVAATNSSCKFYWAEAESDVSTSGSLKVVAMDRSFC